MGGNMKNKLKEMLLQHKPITEQTFDIDDIWGETVATGAEDFEEIPEEEVEDAEVEDVEDVPEEDSHTIADAINNYTKLPSITTKTLEEASGVERDIKFLTKETAFSYTLDSLFANSFLMFRMNNKKSNLPIGTMSSKNTGVIAGLLGGAMGGGLAAIDNMEKYFKSDKLQSDKKWFYENIAQKGTRVRESIENFKNIKSSELSKAKKGIRADLKKVKRAYADAFKSIRDSLNLFNKEHIKQAKK